MFLQNQNGKLNCNKLLLSCNSLQLSSKLIPIGSKFNPLINTQTTLRITAFYPAFHYTIHHTIFAKKLHHLTLPDKKSEPADTL